ncbi:hypothetical protein [Spongiimicrobium sp. 3-5]|uniref:carboxypeptidase-like regulatory domain-containing protein n=1 Tax=Spongiimicrobium sp. 3-5 TaxID=3332596 RepID=UPI003980754B
MRTTELLKCEAPSGDAYPANVKSFVSLILSILFLTMLHAGCSSDGPDQNGNPDLIETGKVQGTVKDENGNPYPSTLITLSKGTENNTKETNTDGVFTMNTMGLGSYDVAMELPLSTEPISVNPTTVNVMSNQTTMVDFVIRAQPAEAHLNIANVDIFDEIRGQDGNAPLSSSELLYAANFFQPPIGLLTAIKAPDGHHVNLSEWQAARGIFTVNCNGASSTVEIALEGMIPNGTYSVWLAFLNKTKKIGEPIVGATDLVNTISPPIGASNGADNVLIAGGDGTINATILHPSCILTQEVALVIPVVYHINGNTFGAGEIPDVEEVSHLLVYFQ